MGLQQSTIHAGNLPIPFNFYRLVLEKDHLHFGLWPEEGEAFSLEEAQDHMFDTLLKRFPDPPASVLDVGCGLGYSAFQLAQKGYQVLGIAPSAELIAYAQNVFPHPSLAFQNAGFLDSEAEFLQTTYDVILFQESLQYLHPLEKAIERAKALLNPAGTLIIGDEMCLTPMIKSRTAVHLSRDLSITLDERGFLTIERQSVGDQVKKTCEQVIQKFTANRDQILSALEETQQDRKEGAAQLDFFLKGWRSQRSWYAKRYLGYELIVAKPDTIHMSYYRKGDEEEILKDFNAVFGVSRTMAHWQWKFAQNPFGAEKIATARNASEEIAAHYCGYPVPYYSSGSSPNDFIVYQSGDTWVAPSFRGNLAKGKKGVLFRVTDYFYRKYCETQVPLIYGYNTGKIRKLGETFLAYEYLEGIPFLVCALAAEDWVYPDRRHRFLNGVSVERVSAVTREYDRFFERVCQSYGTLVKRNAAYLQWRYLDCPDGVHHMYAVRRFGRLVGWAVFTLTGESLSWGDALFDKRFARDIRWILSFVKTHEAPQAKQVEGWVSPVPAWWTQTLTDLGFEIQKEPLNLAPVFKIFDTRFSRAFLAQQHYYTKGDSDLF